jgi:hypothetical protein
MAGFPLGVALAAIEMQQPARAYAAGRPRHGLATRPAPRAPLQPLLCRADGDPPGHRGHGPSRDGCLGVAITVERLAPAGERVARAIGAVVVGVGLFLIARAAGLGTP